MKTKQPTLMELLKHTKTHFFTTPGIRFVHHTVTRHTAIQHSSSCHTRVDILHWCNDPCF